MSKRIAVCMLAGLSLAVFPIGANAGRIVGMGGGQPATQPGGFLLKLNPQPGGNRTVTVTPGTPAPATEPTTEPAETATQPAISPEAQALIDQTAGAYRKLKSLELAGDLKIDADAGGEQMKHSIDFTDSIAGHDRFRHEAKGDVIAGANAKMQYFFQTQSQEYLTAPAAAAHVDDLMAPLPDYLRRADPSLLLMLSNNPSAMLLKDIAAASRDKDTKLDSQSYPTLTLVHSDQSVETVLLDPTTHLIRQVQTDLWAALTAHGQQADHALITVDYTTTTPNAAIKADAFDWTPPAGSTEMGVRK